MNWIDWTVVILLGIEIPLNLISMGRGHYTKKMHPRLHLLGVVYYALLLWYVLDRAGTV